MAGKQNSGVMGVVLGSGAVLALVFVVWKLISAPKANAATMTGGGGAYGYPGYAGTTQGVPQQSGLSGLLNSLLKALGGGSKAGGASTGAGASSAPKTAAPQSQSQLQSEMQAIAGYSSQANSASNPDLGGYSLNSLPSGYDASGVDLSGSMIPYQPIQNFDFGSGSYGSMQDLAGYQNYGGAIDSMDTGDYTDLGYIG
jgi:hypothetical protein